MSTWSKSVFPSADGRTSIHVEKWMPDSGEYDGILQLVHGMVEYIARYDDFARYMADHGWLVVGHDHLGHGDSVVSEREWGYFGENPSDLLVEDMHTLRKMTQEEGKPYFMLGHSMGSFLLRKYLARYGKGLAGAVIMGTGYIGRGTTSFAMKIAKLEGRLRGWHHRSGLLEQLSYSAPYRQYDLSGKDLSRSWLTKDLEIVRSYHVDPKCTFTFTDNGYLGLFEAVQESCSPEGAAAIPVEVPLLLNSGEDDPVGDMGKGVRKVEELYRKAGIRDLTVMLYKNDRHEILNELDRKTVYADIEKWMRDRL